MFVRIFERVLLYYDAIGIAMVFKNRTRINTTRRAGKIYEQSVNSEYSKKIPAQNRTGIRNTDILVY